MSKQTDLINVTDAITVSGSNVGIGATSLGAGRGLTVANGAVAVTSANLSHSTSSLVLGQDSASISQIRFYGANTSTAGILQFTGSSSDGIVGGDRMRIDSSGNLLVGKTSAGYNVDGFEAHQNGETYVSRSGTPMAINRNSSNGTLLNFYKDGGGVGSIAVDPSNIAIGSGDTGIYFNSGDDALIPVGTGGNLLTSRDSAIDLGRTSTRFKDLYLSGGVYLGGTGSANKLDDYEQGTWTGSISFGGGTTGQSYAGNTGYYTKVGQAVTITVYVNFSNQGSSTGNAKIEGLPFTCTGGSAYNPGGLHLNQVSFTGFPQAYVLVGQTTISLGQTSESGTFSNLTHSNFTNGTGLIFATTYMTDA